MFSRPALQNLPSAHAKRLQLRELSQYIDHTTLLAVSRHIQLEQKLPMPFGYELQDHPPRLQSQLHLVMMLGNAD